MSEPAETKLPLREQVPRLALTPPEAAMALGVSDDHFRRHIDAELRWIRRGRKRMVAIVELERWLDRNAERTLEASP
jgi:hypothetical protein